MKKLILMLLFFSIFFSGCRYQGIRGEVLLGPSSAPTPTAERPPSQKEDYITNPTLSIEENQDSVCTVTHLLDEPRGYDNSKFIWGGNSFEGEDGLFYAPSTVDYGGSSDSFLRISAHDGQVAKMSEDNAFFIHEVGEVLYYLNKEYDYDEELESAIRFGFGGLKPTGVFRINKDGTNRTQVYASNSITSMLMIAGEIFLSDLSGSLLKLSTDGKILATYRLFDEIQSPQASLQYDNGYLYYMILNEPFETERRHLVKRFDISHGQVVSEYVFPSSGPNSGCIVKNDHIYFDSSLGLIRAGLDGREETIFPEKINTFLVSDEIIYLCLLQNIFDGKGEIIKLCMEHQGIVEVIPIFEQDEFSMPSICLRAIGREYIYFYYNGGSDSSDFMRVRLDGSGLESLEITGPVILR